MRRVRLDLEIYHQKWILLSRIGEQGKIRSLNWVTAAMLETGIDEKDVKVRAIIDDAISAIIEMDSKRAPADKLKTLVDCSKLIFEALHASSG